MPHAVGAPLGRPVTSPRGPEPRRHPEADEPSPSPEIDFSALRSDPEKRRLIPYLLRHGGTEERVLSEWVRSAEVGLLPYGGAWRTAEEIEHVQRRARRRSWIVLLELLLILGALLAFNLLGYRFFPNVLWFLSFG